jgi:hypothetical protein
MSKALEIAEKLLDLNDYGTAPYILCKIAALELERLDALNAELVEACKAMVAYDNSDQWGDFITMMVYYHEAIKKARAALAKAKEQS